MDAIDNEMKQAARLRHEQMQGEFPKYVRPSDSDFNEDGPTFRVDQDGRNVDPCKYVEAERALRQVNEEIDAANRDQLLEDERVCGVAFIHPYNGARVDPLKVFKSVVNTYADNNGNPVMLWKSEAHA